VPEVNTPTYIGIVLALAAGVVRALSVGDDQAARRVSRFLLTAAAIAYVANLADLKSKQTVNLSGCAHGCFLYRGEYLPGMLPDSTTDFLIDAVLLFVAWTAGYLCMSYLRSARRLPPETTL
jgi:hypothetical protein